MLRLTLSTEEYLLIGDNIKIVFLGGSKSHLRIMIDAPKEIGVVRSKVIKNHTVDPEIRDALPTYYAEPELAERFRKKKNSLTVKEKQK